MPNPIFGSILKKRKNLLAIVSASAVVEAE
jgi:hypothetical protein